MFTPPSLPLTCDPRTERGSSGFPLSSTPGRAGPSNACQGGDGPRTLPGLRPRHQPASFDALTHHVRPHVAAIDHHVAGRGTAPAGLGKPGCPSPPTPPATEEGHPDPRQERPYASPRTLRPPRFAPLPPPAMIRSRTAASRAPAAPLRGRFAPPDPGPPARRNRQQSGQGSTLKHALNRKRAHRRTTCRTAAMQVSGRRRPTTPLRTA